MQKLFQYFCLCLLRGLLSRGLFAQGFNVWGVVFRGVIVRGVNVQVVNVRGVIVREVNDRPPYLYHLSMFLKATCPNRFGFIDKTITFYPGFSNSILETDNKASTEFWRISLGVRSLHKGTS